MSEEANQFKRMVTKHHIELNKEVILHTFCKVCKKVTDHAIEERGEWEHYFCKTCGVCTGSYRVR